METQNPLSDEPLYHYLHQFLLDVCGHFPSPPSSQDVLEEVFRLCRQAATDATPGENLEERYINDLRNRVHSQRTAELVLCLSWVVLMVQERQSYAVSTFTRQLRPIICRYSAFLKARQLAVTIRQNERHISTDFYLITQAHPSMKIEIEGNPGTGNSFTEVHIDKVENYNPAATTVITKHYHFDGNALPASEEAIDAAAEAVERHAEKQDDRIDTTPIRSEILNYVSCIRPYLADDWKSRYMNVWEDILDLDIIASQVYKPGKQQGTNFNRNLVANIIYYLDSCGAYKDKYNASTMTVALEGDKDHSVRSALGSNPPADVVSRLRRYFTE